jgi:hypothetical protein
MKRKLSSGQLIGICLGGWGGGRSPAAATATRHRRAGAAQHDVAVRRGSGAMLTVLLPETVPDQVKEAGFYFALTFVCAAVVLYSIAQM